MVIAASILAALSASCVVFVAWQSFAEEQGAKTAEATAPSVVAVKHKHRRHRDNVKNKSNA
jgi:hypothetical protein